MGTIQNGTMEEMWHEVEEKLKNNKDPYSNLKGTYEIRITDENIKYQLSFSNGDFAIENQGNENPDCTLKMKSTEFRKLLAGKLNSSLAFMTGKLKVEGNITLALKLESMLKQYQF